jgi:bifunctional UDP-N-acetylglucosamine pyrophosphorylase/glucosamine-1-phosphate N-acetyltransferase
MEANLHMAHAVAGNLAETSLDEGAGIDPGAQIEGYVKLGKGAQIGPNVVIRGNVVVGEGSRIADGAILEGDMLIGRGCLIGPYCQIASASVIGDHCVVGHCAEFQGVLFDNVALGHFMEVWGVIGQSVDFGAGTLCGTLRFDNAQVSQSVKGRRESAGRYANALYMGDFSRTGVGAKLMPGLKVGCRSIVGAGVLASEDVPDNTALLLKQEHIVKKWGSERYGW